MTETTLASLAGIVLSVAFSYIPGLRDKFAQLSADYKRLVMLGSLLAVVLGVFGLSCVGYYPQITCDAAGAKTLIELFVAALIANQAAYMITPSVSAG
jgi:hypothetical protein